LAAEVSLNFSFAEALRNAQRFGKKVSPPAAKPRAGP
jgi:hypothetical protein